MSEQPRAGARRPATSARVGGTARTGAPRERGASPDEFDLGRYTTHVAEVVARLDRAQPGEAIPLATITRAAPAPPGSLARALKALAGRRVVVVKATEAGIVVRLRAEDASSGGDLPSYPPGTREWRVARWLTRRGQRPTEAAVAERLRAIEAARRSEERRARWKAELETETPAVVAFVREVRAATGAGPTWAEVGGRMSWKYAEGNFKLGRLITGGVLTATREPRSLNLPEPEVDAAARLAARPAELLAGCQPRHLDESA